MGGFGGRQGNGKVIKLYYNLKIENNRCMAEGDT